MNDHSVNSPHSAGQRLPQPPLGTPNSPTASLPPDGGGGGTTQLGQGEGPELAHENLPIREGNVGRYRLDGLLGQGGMGLVFRAHDPDLRRHVALKLIQGRHAHSDEIKARFLAEAQVTAQLQHPAIIPVHEMGVTDEGEVYYTMQLVQGRTLSELVREELGRRNSSEDFPQADRWSRFRLLQTLVLVCRTVAYAHSCGVLHRDLKPDNLMIGRFGQVYVLDWGVAKVMTESRVDSLEEPLSLALDPDGGESVETTIQAGTKVGAVLGTPAYMAPEQAAGSGLQALGPEVDVYSLGAILYFLLSGVAPHQGQAREIITRIALGIPPPPPSAIRDDIPEPLEQICLQALRYRPEERVPSADFLADALQAYLEGRPFEPSRKRDSNFLRSFSARESRRPEITVDVVLVRRIDGVTLVWLHQRDKPPYEGAWTLPGSFLEIEESLDESAQRVLSEKVGLKRPPLRLVQLGAWGAPSRDPRTRIIAVAYLAEAEPRSIEASSTALWFRPEDPGVDIAFDHATILSAAMAHLAQEEAD